MKIIEYDPRQAQGYQGEDEALVTRLQDENSRLREALRLTRAELMKECDHITEELNSR